MRTPLFAIVLAALLATLLSAAPARAATPSAAKFLKSSLDPALYDRLAPDQRRMLRDYARTLLASPPALPLLTRCFSPDTPADLVEAFHALEEAAASRPGDPNAPARATQLESRWNATATNGTGQGVQGLPVTLTWSIVPDGTPVPSSPGNDSNDNSNLRQFLTGLYGGSASGPPASQPWFVHFQTIFDNISAKTGLSYLYVAYDDMAPCNAANKGVPGVRADVRIAGHEIDGMLLFGSSGTLAYNWYPDQGDMVIDTADDWLSDNIANTNAITNLLEHEHGHGLGLEHICPANGTKLMEPFILSTYRGLRFDDIYSLQRHYGDFYEKHNPARNNDDPANAADLPVVPNTPFAVEWLSIDDNSDSDFFKLNLVTGSRVTVRVIPSNQIYAEGPENSNCTASGSFDSTSLHDLSLALLAPDQSTVLASGPGLPAGQTEQFTNFITTQNGIHYLRILGGSADAAQLYRLEVEVIPPSVDVALTSIALAAESFSLQNGAPDPGETVRYDLTLTGTGTIPATNLQATLTGPAGFTPFTSQNTFANLPLGATSKRGFTFALDGTCGALLNLSLQVTADGGYAESFPVPLTLGTTLTLLNEAADASPSLPPGWSTSVTGVGTPWTTSTTRSSSPSRSFFTPNPSNVATAILQSPSLTLALNPSTLSFRQYYNTETTYDGGVLEISTNNGPWLDILAAGGSFTANGYNRTLLTGSANPLGNRQAWSGNSNSFLHTILTLPPSSQGLPIRLRWILASDNSTGDEGWYLDDILLTTTSCDTTGPVLTLGTSDATADEFILSNTATLTLTTPLPPLHPVPFSFLNSGTADPALDVTGLDASPFPAGQTSTTLTVQALPDPLNEGPESLNLTLPGGLGSALLAIQDSPYGQWAFPLLGTGSLSGPFQDFDGDGLSNIGEYTHQTSPTMPSPAPDLHPSVAGSFFRLTTPPNVPPDVLLGAESSETLLSWSSTGLQTLPDGFQFPRSSPRQFLRLTYQLLPFAP